MSYRTEMSGSITVDPPLNEHEISYLRDFCATRHFRRVNHGPLHIDTCPNLRVESAVDRDVNTPPQNMPYFECPVTVSDKAELIPDPDNPEPAMTDAWLDYLINHLLTSAVGAADPHPTDLTLHATDDPRLAHFTADHVANGRFTCQGENHDDAYDIVVENNTVSIDWGE